MPVIVVTQGLLIIYIYIRVCKNCNAVLVLQVTVENMMHTEVTALHWHGVYPIDPWMEGSNGVTQCGITRGSFTYKFTVRAPPGTYWWHGHAGSQRIGALLQQIFLEHQQH